MSYKTLVKTLLRKAGFAIYSIPTFDWITNLMGIGGILIGFVPLYLGGLRRAQPS